MKAIYYMYLILVPICLIKKKIFKKIFELKNILIIFILSVCLSINILTNYFNTGCFYTQLKKLV
jgi:hypothetical protein